MVTKLRSLSALPEGFAYRLDLARAATPRDLKDAPRHRWFYFPHSYSPRLVHEILDYWQLPEGSVVLDPFVGAGTTVLVARERGLLAIGFDLSPLAVLVSNVKVGSYDRAGLQESLAEVVAQAQHDSEYPGWDSERLQRAFTSRELLKIWALSQAISSQPGEVRDFLTLALLRTVSRFSRAIADGGWFRWSDGPDQSGNVIKEFECQTTLMIRDLVSVWAAGQPGAWQSEIGDARSLPLGNDSVEGLVTSPPYPNRHDYTRVFHIELLLLGLSEQAIIELRRRPIRSHVEAKAPDGRGQTTDGYQKPALLEAVFRSMPARTDKRVVRMLQGYFEDLYLSLREAHRVLRPGGRAAFVVGNVKHAGVLVPVDEILRDLAHQAGFMCDSVWVIRLRGNSAQQMGRFGRQASRESCVLLRNPTGGHA